MCKKMENALISVIITVYNAEKDSRVHVIHKRNEGAPKARKVGCEFPKGAYLLIINADD